MEPWLAQALQAVGLGGVLVLALAFGQLRTNREFQEKEVLFREHMEDMRQNHRAELLRQTELHRQAIEAKDAVITTCNKELVYWRGTSIKLLEAGERLMGDG